MFARVLDEMIEPFMGSDKIKPTQNYFSKILPNMIYNNDPKMEVAKLTEVSNTRIATNQDILRQRWMQTDKNKEILLKKEAECKDNRGLDPLDHLTKLNDTEDQSTRLRCGWIYNKTNPKLGGGALGLKEGPISSKAPGVWNWDLKLATEQMHVDMCKNIQDCKDIDRQSLQQRCGWCERLQKGVPITKAGNVAYPWNKVGGCPASNIVTNTSKCPANPPSDEGEETIPEPCEPLADGRMSRACMMEKYKAAGCSDNGSLGRALAKGNDYDYMNSIYSQKAYKIYQQRAPLSFNEFGLKSGKISMNDALNEFDRLSSVASAFPSGGNAFNFATRDLCLNQGELDNFDFCTELKDNDVGPYPLDCLQKAFLKAGGQKNGNMYPSSSNIARWNAQPTWKAALTQMQEIKRDAGSNDRDIKYLGTKDLLDMNTKDPFQCSTNILPRNINLSKGNVIGKFIMTQDYKLEFDVTPKGTVNGMASLIHFTSDGTNGTLFGQRSPAFWFLPGTLGLTVRIGDSKDGNWGFDNVGGCQIGKKSHITLQTMGRSVRLTVDASTYDLTQPSYRYSGPITVFASGPLSDPANAIIKNVCLQTLGNSTKIPVGPFRVTVGSSTTNEKVVPLPPGIPKDFRNIKILSQGNSNEFVSRIDGNNLVVKRVDAYTGWTASYIAEIGEGPQLHVPDVSFVTVIGGVEELNVSQIVVLNEYGQNISKGRPQKVNSEPLRDANRTKANDGAEMPRGMPNIYHGNGRGADYWQVKLDGPSKVSAVVIYNRGDCCQTRMSSGFMVKLENQSSKLLFASNKLNASLVQVVKTVA